MTHYDVGLVPWKPPWPRKLLLRRVRSGVVFAVLAGLSILFVMPLAWMLSTSLKTNAQLFSDPPIWIPNPIAWENYSELVHSVPILFWTRNTLIIVCLGIVGQLASSSLAAYAFARLDFRGRDVVFVLVLSTMMLPFWVTVVPTYKIFSLLGWIRTFRPLIVPSFFGGAFYIFLLRQFLLTLPRELDEAAEIDGCSFLGIYWRILLPLVKPALATVAVFSFISDWNDFFRPLIYLSTYDLKNVTLAIGLATLSDESGTNQQLVMAGSVYSILPILVVFFLAQRHFVQGIALTGRTGT